MKQKLIAQGAEAKIIKENNFIIKDRISKGYRLKQLDDSIRKQRTKKEAKLLINASEIINSPKPFFIPDFYTIKMPYVEGKKLSEHLDNLEIKKAEKICEQIGESIAKLHDNGIIHGDLTTSNIILVKKSEGEKLKKENSNNTNNNSNTEYKLKKNILLKKSNKRILAEPNSKQQNASDSEQVWFIDFGLGFHSSRLEDKAVDLHLIKQALEAKHFQNWKKYYQSILKGYKISKNYKPVLEQLTKVELRGRYKGH
ncbi:MAG: lipopolysaccharide kinase InaA family protein [Candidatus Pacearchaeota archaeon]